jgi:hypothetical protein
MPHSTDLILMILAKVELDYPPERYRYSIEKFLPGTRMAPDIVVFGPKGETLCVVEIGYTRPEKLTAYRKIHKIADVRWYDKTGLLHGDVQEKTVRLTVAFDSEMEVSVYNPFHIIPCRASDCFDEPEEDAEDPDKEIERAEEEAQDDVETVLVSDDTRVWIVNFCDKCGELWLSSDPDDPDVAWVFENLRDGDGRSNAAMWGARERMPWNEISNRLKSAFDFTLVYEDGVWLQPRKQRLFERNVMRLTPTKPLPLS